MFCQTPQFVCQRDREIIKISAWVAISSTKVNKRKPLDFDSHRGMNGESSSQVHPGKAQGRWPSVQCVWAEQSELTSRDPFLHKCDSVWIASKNIRVLRDSRGLGYNFPPRTLPDKFVKTSANLGSRRDVCKARGESKSTECIYIFDFHRVDMRDVKLLIDIRSWELNSTNGSERN
jgi:hypothetical protein